MMDYTPDIVQVVPNEDHTVFVTFADGKTVCYDVKPLLGKGIIQQLQDLAVFMDCCAIMNDTLAWDVSGTRDATACIDIDPDTLYELECTDERVA